MADVPYRKKLIEVALPLEAINRESAREKSIRHGHPSTLHLWWSRKPLATCRAVLFASIVDDPSSRPDEFPTVEDQERERQRLFRIIEELVKWENTNNEQVLGQARAEILKATDGNPPPVLDPFCGGGSIPLEAQRLGLEAHASDLNPVAVLITKALTEIPPKFAGKPPVNPEARAKLTHEASWKGTQGLADDVRYYARLIGDRAFEQVGHLFPQVRLRDGSDATVIAWLWLRTAECPNPACGMAMPLTSKFTLSTRKGNEWFVEPLVDPRLKTIDFAVRPGRTTQQGTVNRQGATCLACGNSASFDYLRSEGRAGRMGTRLMAIVAEGNRGRLYMPASEEHEALALSAQPYDVPDTDLPHQALGFRVQAYGMTKHSDLFSSRQLTALVTFSDLVHELRDLVLRDGGDASYADAIATYLSLAIGRCADKWATLTVWNTAGEKVEHVFGMQTLSMRWDFADGNPFSNSTGNWVSACEWVARAVEQLPGGRAGVVDQLDASVAARQTTNALLSSDPPYYDNVPYGDLSDFFYVWLRRSLKGVYPDLLSTLLVPKAQELLADPGRFDGDRRASRDFFEAGMATAFLNLNASTDSRFPASVYYAFKQAETTADGGVVSTGWETMLSGLLKAGFSITGTWPVRSERPGRLRETGSNALASSIVLVCRPSPADAKVTTRREFIAALRGELPESLRNLQRGNVAPVDLAQAAIGPGMAVFSRYAKVLEADGTAMTVRSALALINQALDEILAEQEGDFDADTRFAVTWFEQRGFEEGPFGEADVLARAKDTSVDGMVEAGVLFSRAGKVRLLRRDEMPGDWDPVTDQRPTAWEAAQHLTQRLQTGGEAAAAELLRRLGGGYGEEARELAYRLYSVCERKGWAQEALPYNALVVAWPEIARRVAGTPEAEAQQTLEV